MFSQPLRAAFPTNAKTEKYEFYKFESAFAAAIGTEHLADT